ncbi:MAG TPA: ATP-binding cassette domain-containing protein [Gemmatimonadaceae bacterium]|nr:ATP-binding cassette domain-containing protein [Gemmatimonadaceae bacterium]
MSAALEIAGLRVMRGSREVLRGVDLTIQTGELCALMGVSGAGKSTVLRAIAALEPISDGRVALGDVTLAPGPLPPESRLRALRRHVGMVFQSASLFEHMTALDNVTLAPVYALGWPRDKAEGVARRLLGGLGVGARAEAYPRQLSGGEAQRVAIARALAPDPELLLMDEPTSALDPARRGALGESLRTLAREGRALLIATHDVDFALAFADRVAVLHEGVIVETGAAADVLRSPRHDATRELLRADALEPRL